MKAKDATASQFLPLEGPSSLANMNSFVLEVKWQIFPVIKESFGLLSLHSNAGLQINNRNDNKKTVKTILKL